MDGGNVWGVAVPPEGSESGLSAGSRLTYRPTVQQVSFWQEDGLRWEGGLVSPMQCLKSLVSPVQFSTSGMMSFAFPPDAPFNSVTSSLWMVTVGSVDGREGKKKRG